MDRKVKKYLDDILYAISEIESFLAQRPRQYQVFVDDHMFRSAIERQVGIIGEAMTKILQLYPDINITEAKNIKGTRNYIVHAYDTLQPHTIWAIVINDLPKLKQEVINLIKD
ncbi:MAG: DUF86 domain-containing protein [Muribaculaceae bacterium]|nr:DUF86 domain-containing protein [Muribaculaceae bacterium]MDE6794779.1 DUF86 domain-containing protein [Muribaculaceae bacterium]